MKPKTTAIVLIEFQNDFTSEGGTLHAAVKPIMDATNMLANTVDLANQARALGVQILLFSRPMADQAVISGLRGDHLSRARTRGYEAA